MKIKIEKTCGFAPEQYDVMSDGVRVAYVRLRWGGLTVQVPGPLGELIYSYDFNSEYKGEFKNQSERTKYLRIVKKKILDYYKSSDIKRKEKVK